MSKNQVLLLSIRPNFADLIFAGSKTVELRRVKPRLKKGDLVVVYASGSSKCMKGAFEVEGVTSGSPSYIWRKHRDTCGVSKEIFFSYFGDVSIGYAIQIGRLWEYNQPIPLTTLRKNRAGFRPPQSYHYWLPEDLAELEGNTIDSPLAFKRSA